MRLSEFLSRYKGRSPLIRILRKLGKRIVRTRPVYLGNLYKHLEVEYLRKVFETQQIDCVFDVGAHHGEYATMLRRRVGFRGLIVSFEPMPEALNELSARSSRDKNWIVMPYALSNQDGTSQMNIMANTEFNSLRNPTHDNVKNFVSMNRVISSISVETRTLESAFYSLKAKFQFLRPFLKLDTQGYDVGIVEASADVLPRFAGLQSELAVEKIYEGSVGFLDALSLYRSLGFTLAAFVPNNMGHFPRMIETDCIMIRSDLID